MIELRDYQTTAVQELFYSFEKMMKSSINEVCIFKAPTGSGKTVVVSELLRKLVKEKKEYSLSFIWIAPRSLHDQSKIKLETYYYDQLLKCSNFDDLQDDKIDQNEILFVNWESVNQEANVIRKGNEEDRNLSNVLKKTKNAGNEIVLIIDESHHTAGGEQSLKVIDIIEPKITLEVSATPGLRDPDYERVKVRLEDVINAEIIKNEILVNPEFLKIKVGSQDADEIVIKEALKKREFLKKGFEQEGANVNPLVLIQLPDKIPESMNEKMDDIIKKLKTEFDISVENNKLAKWFATDKSENLDNIEENDNPVEVLIFKKAISLGWDCPRASILVVFREYNNFEFSIQTIGRIMRMPEWKHYTKVLELNKGYIFTNLNNIELTEDYVKSYVSQYESHRNESIYKSIKLRSIYLQKQRKKTRLSGEFKLIFNAPEIINSLKTKITKNPSKIIQPLLSDGFILNVDKTGEIPIKGHVEIKLSDKDVQNRFDEFVRSACSPFAPHDSSHRIKSALYKFIEDEYGFDKYGVEAQQIVLGAENYQFFWNAIDEAKKQFTAKIIGGISQKREEDVTLDWEIPKVMPFNDNCVELKKSHCIMEPFFTKKLSNPEQKFIERLSISKKINWWYKNGDSEKKYFSVPYVDKNGKDALFFVDFIIQFADGRIGLFDTKDGIHAGDEDAGPRHDGLYYYLQTENKKGKNLVGGIIVDSNGTWRYNDKKKYHYDKNNLSDWKILEF